MSQSATQQPAGYIKPVGDLSGDAAAGLKENLHNALRHSPEDIVVDLARPSVIDGRCLAALLMARNSAEASGRPFQIKLGHEDWVEFQKLDGLREVVSG